MFVFSTYYHVVLLGLRGKQKKVTLQFTMLTMQTLHTKLTMLTMHTMHTMHSVRGNCGGLS